MTSRVSIALALFTMLLVSSLPRTTSAAVPEYDLIIRNGRVIDGSGRPEFTADVGIKGDRIVRIGNLRGARSKRVIDAQGQVVAPGFIDMLGQSETFLLIDPRAMSKVMMGVTTEITGEGESIAPINERQIKEQEDFNRRFHLNIDWRTLSEYFQRLERQRTGLNLGTFVGATQVREYVVGYDDRPTAAIQGHLEAHLKEMGADVEVTHRWAGTMGFTDSGFPMVGPVDDMPNVYLCAGYNGHGMGFAFMSAKQLVSSV